MSLALLVVYYNVVCVTVELVLLVVLRAARRGLRSVSLSPSRWRFKRRVWDLKQQMVTAPNFESWLKAARALDDMEGGTAWRAERTSDEYDAELVVATTRSLREHRRARDARGLMLALRSVVHRGYGGITRPALFEHAYTGTKVALEALVTEVCSCLDIVSDAPDIPETLKASFIDQLRVQLGRTALALSGGGVLALAHAGVVRTLLSAGLLPRVISGTSGGAIMAGMMATKTDMELLDSVLVPGIVAAQGPKNVFFGPPWQQVHNFLTTGRLVDTDRFSSVLRAFIGDETFLSAWQRTGRIVNVSVVARAGPSASYNLQLNYLTAPHVLVWSAVAASCALPGLMRPVTIQARDDLTGRVVPYHIASSMRSIDGSMAVDIPRRELGLMFHVDTLLVSQANPHVVPFLSLARDSLRVEGGHGSSLGGGAGVTARGGRLDANPLSRALQASSLWLLLDVRHRMHLLAGLRLLPRWFGEEAGPLFGQSYTGECMWVGDYGHGGSGGCLIAPQV